MVTAIRRSKRDGRYPLAAITAYGPDGTLATKLVVSILKRPDADPAEARTWTTVAVDVRTDATISAAVDEFLVEQRVRQRVATDRIIGCPHQETIDYPLGRDCPKCPFWAGRDRFTHELLTLPPPTMSAEEVLDALADNTPDRRDEALQSADALRSELVDPLVASIERAAADPQREFDDPSEFCTALYVLAKWRERQAYRPIVRWLSLPGELAFDISGDIITQNGARILASVFDGDIAAIRELILNREANAFARGAGISAVALLGAWAEIPRQTVIDELRWLATEGLERKPGPVWCELLEACLDLEAAELIPVIRPAFADGLIDPQYMSTAEFEREIAQPEGRLLARTIDEKPPIGDVADETAWWSWSDEEEEEEGDADLDVEDQDADAESLGPDEPFVAPPKVGRNATCPCGSGKKYKKCCGQ